MRKPLKELQVAVENHNETYMKQLNDGKTEKLAELVRTRFPGKLYKLLVVGCGTGLEAAVLAQSLRAETIGIDITNNFNPGAADYADLRLGDAMALDFPDDYFDFVYSYHALEHISDPRKALSEIARVLRTGGGYCIGTPNRSRVVGYLGSKTATWKQKFQWNIIDWKARFAGKFRNEYGAHAGFSASELQGLLSERFEDTVNITNDYYYAVYRRHYSLLSQLIRVRLDKWLFPSVYFFGIK